MLSLSCLPLAGALILIKLIMGRGWGQNSLRDYLTSDNDSSHLGLAWDWGLRSTEGNDFSSNFHFCLGLQIESLF